MMGSGRGRTDFPALDALGVKPQREVDEAGDDGAHGDLHCREARQGEEGRERPAVNGPGDVGKEERGQEEVVDDPVWFVWRVSRLCWFLCLFHTDERQETG